MKIRFITLIDKRKHALEANIAEEDLIDKNFMERQVRQLSHIPAIVIRDALKAQRTKALKKKYAK